MNCGVLPGGDRCKKVGPGEIGYYGPCGRFLFTRVQADLFYISLNLHLKEEGEMNEDADMNPLGGKAEWKEIGPRRCDDSGARKLRKL